MRLVYFSSCGLDAHGKPDPFMMQEHDWLLKRFGKVQMACRYGVATLGDDDGGYIRAHKPALAGLRAVLAAPFSRDLWRGLGRMRRGGALSAVNALKLCAFVTRGLKMSYRAEALLADLGDEPLTLYSCWMSYDGYAAALVKRRRPKARFVARGHAFDIDAERNPLNPWLMKDEIAALADGLYPISEAARERLMSYMRGRVDEGKVHVLAMGSGGAPVPLKPAPRLTDGVLHVISCAAIIEIKRVRLLAEALAAWDGCPVSWTHIGGGEGEAELREYCEQSLDRKENVLWELMGQLDGAEVLRLYEERSFDLFVNTSRSEGSPVSIMEAMRCGIPIIAPRVGGIPEMLAGGAGMLFEPQTGAEGVLKALEEFTALSDGAVQAMREAAKATWDERYQSDRLLGKLFEDGGGSL